MLDTFIEEKDNEPRRKEPLDKEVIRDYLKADKKILDSFNGDFNVQVSVDIKSDEPENV